MIQLKETQLLAGAFALVVAVAVGTFTVTVLAKGSGSAALKLRTEMVDRQNSEMQNRLNHCLTAKGPSTSANSSTAFQTTGDTPLVELLSPKDGEKVPPFIDVRYIVHGEIPGGYRPIWSFVTRLASGGLGTPSDYTRITRTTDARAAGVL